MRSTATGRKKGYGFVEMRTKAQAGAAKALLGATNFHGRSLRIDWCRLGKLEELHSPVLFVDKLPPNFVVRTSRAARTILPPPRVLINARRGTGLQWAEAAVPPARHGQERDRALQSDELDSARLRVCHAFVSRGGGEGCAPSTR